MIMVNKSIRFYLKFMLITVGMFCLNNTSFAQAYCTPSLNTNGNIYWVDSIKTMNAIVNLNYINQPNPVVNASGYTDLSTTTFTSEAGATFDLFLHGRALFSYHWNVYIDWNENGILNDPGEMVISYLSNPQLANYTQPITVPAATTPGNKRMRVMMLRIGTTTNPCIIATSTYGYVTDFTLIIQNNKCPGPVYTDSVSVNICTGDQYTIGNKIYNTTGIYVDTFKNINDCDSIIITDLEVNERYHFDVKDSTYAGYPYTFHDTQYTASGWYKHNYQTELGCDSNYTLTLKVIPVVFDTLYTEICRGDSILIFDKYYNANTVTNDTLIENWGHRLTHIVVKVNSLPNITIQPLYNHIGNYCLGDTVTLKAAGGVQYEWYLKELDKSFKMLSADSNLLHSKIFFNETSFKVAVVDDKNCKNEKEFTLIGENCCEIQVPTAFTPNNDGLNDVFRVIAKAQPQRLVVRIYNRLGQLVYFSNSIHDTWKGMDNKGNPLATDTYFYHVSGQCWDGTAINIKGDITLLR